jgi:RNA polymerase sigma-70 factor (ECF subfamily)
MCLRANNVPGLRELGRRNATELLEEARGGRKESLGTLLELYRNYLQLLARTQVDLQLGRRASPSDLVQETFLEAYRDFGQFRGTTVAELRAWLRRILVHNIYRLVERQMQAQKRDLRREVSIDECFDALERSSAPLEAGLVSPGGSPSTREERLETAAIVSDHLSALPHRYRDVLVLRNLEGLSFDEVAERMGITTGAARMLWMRALDRLKVELEKVGLL